MHYSFPTIQELTRGAVGACRDCNCNVCRANARSLERVLGDSSRRRKHVNAIVELPTIFTNAKSPEYHQRVIDLVVATTMAWSHSFDSYDQERRTLAVEYFGDAWRRLMACQSDEAFAGEYQSPGERATVL